LQQQAIMQLQQENNLMSGKSSFIPQVPISKYYQEQDAHDQVGLMHQMLQRIDAVYGDDENLDGLWEKVQ